MPDRKSRTTGALAAVGAGLMAVVLAGCNDAALPTAPDAVVENGTVVLSRTFSDVEAGGTRRASFTLSRAGALDVQVSWSSQDNSVTAFVVGRCPGARSFDNDCRLRGSMDRSSRENRIGTHGMPGDYEVLVQNEGPGAESITVIVRGKDDPDVPGPAPEPGHNPPFRGLEQ